MNDHRPSPSISVSAPDLSERERGYLMGAFDSSWISSTGPFVDRFERAFAEFIGVEHAVSCTNGTCALHLALLAQGIGPGDEVIVPACTYVATANAVRYVGAEPVFADIDPDTWTIDPASFERLITEETRAVVPVHLFGVPADMEAISALARRHELAVIEDAAEAHGARFDGRPTGGWGSLSIFSFYGNKILTTGEGGMVCTNDPDLARRVRMLRGQGAAPDRHYWFDTVGYNYRMTNLACAIGLAQLERFEELRGRREMVRTWYDAAFERLDLLVPGVHAGPTLPFVRQKHPARAEPVLWIYGVVLDGDLGITRDELREALAAQGIETRPFFPALHTLPIHAGCRHDGDCPVSRLIGDCGLMLPTHTLLQEPDVKRVVEVLGSAIREPIGAA